MKESFTVRGVEFVDRGYGKWTAKISDDIYIDLGSGFGFRCLALNFPDYQPIHGATKDVAASNALRLCAYRAKSLHQAFENLGANG